MKRRTFISACLGLAGLALAPVRKLFAKEPTRRLITVTAHKPKDAQRAKMLQDFLNSPEGMAKLYDHMAARLPKGVLDEQRSRVE